MILCKLLCHYARSGRHFSVKSCTIPSSGCLPPLIHSTFYISADSLWARRTEIPLNDDYLGENVRTTWLPPPLLIGQRLLNVLSKCFRCRFASLLFQRWLGVHLTDSDSTCLLPLPCPPMRAREGNPINLESIGTTTGDNNSNFQGRRQLHCLATVLS